MNNFSCITPTFHIFTFWKHSVDRFDSRRVVKLSVFFDRESVASPYFIVPDLCSLLTTFGPGGCGAVNWWQLNAQWPFWSLSHCSVPPLETCQDHSLTQINTQNPTEQKRFLPSLTGNSVIQQHRQVQPINFIQLYKDLFNYHLCF